MRILAILLILAAIGYAAVCGLLYLRQRQLLYYPQFTRSPATETNFQLQRPDGIVVRGWQLHQDEPDALIYFGGNAEDLRTFRDQANRAFPHHAVYMVAYRGYGASDGKPGQIELLRDALALYDQVRALHPDGRIDIIGRSLGSGVASYVASQRPVQRLVLVTPFDSLMATAAAHYPWVPVRWLLKDTYPSDAYLHDFHGELLVLRAGHDQVVFPANTDRLIAALPRQPQVIEFADTDHTSIASDPRYLRALEVFLAPQPELLDQCPADAQNCT